MIPAAITTRPIHARQSRTLGWRCHKLTATTPAHRIPFLNGPAPFESRITEVAVVCETMVASFPCAAAGGCCLTARLHDLYLESIRRLGPHTPESLLQFDSIQLTTRRGLALCCLYSSLWQHRHVITLCHAIMASAAAGIVGSRPITVAIDLEDCRNDDVLAVSFDSVTSFPSTQ